MALQHRSDPMTEQRTSLIGFVWRPEEITPAVIHMAQRTGSRAVFDFSLMGVGGLRSFLRKADTAGHVSDIKISIPTFWVMPPSQHQQLVINIPELRLYFFDKTSSTVQTYPIGIGDEGWESPLGTFSIVEKRPRENLSQGHPN